MRTASEARFLSGVLALSVHVLVFIFLVISFNWQRQNVGPVYVELWQELPAQQQKVDSVRQPPKKKKEEPNKVVKEVEPPKRKPPAVPPNKPSEAAELPKPKPKPQTSAAEIELKERKRKLKEQEAKYQEQLAKLQETSRIQEEDRSKKRREDIKKAAADREKMEEMRELRRKERRQAAQEQHDKEKLLADENKRAAEENRKRRKQAVAQERARAESLVEIYMGRIAEKVRENVVMPLDLTGNPEALYDIILLSSGEVYEIVLKKSSGFLAYDMAIRRAIEKAQPLPVPKDQNLFSTHFRKFEMKFRPKE